MEGRCLRLTEGEMLTGQTTNWLWKNKCFMKQQEKDKEAAARALICELNSV